jgi:hypothetical protein
VFAGDSTPFRLDRSITDNPFSILLYSYDGFFSITTSFLTTFLREQAASLDDTRPKSHQHAKQKVTVTFETFLWAGICMGRRDTAPF